MYIFNKKEEDFLKRFGDTANGKEMVQLLKSMAQKADSTSSISKDSDYGAQVEGRRIVKQLFDSLIEKMTKINRNKDIPEEGIDEYS